MIDDFVKRPEQPKRRPTGKKDGANDDLVPDLSAPATDKPTAKKSDFITPEQAAAKDDEAHVDDVIDMGEEEKPSKGPLAPKERWWKRLGAWFKGLSKKKKALVIIAVLLVVGGAGAGVYALTQGDAKPAAKVTPKKKPAPKPDTVANALTGRQVKPEINERPVIAVMVENSLEARPQSGLYDAGIVFEAIAEGGITRFLALYQDTEPESIGPVRSARPYYIDWALGFDAAYAHAGGSPEALQKISATGTKDLNDHRTYFQRVTHRYSPHNLYTSHALLSQYAASKNFGKSDFTSFPRKKDAASKAPDAKNITLNISSARYNVSYTYDAATNSYLRNLAGAPHNDANNSKQINPKVVVAMVMQHRVSNKYSIYNTIGSGPVTIFQDGVATSGTWAKTSADSQITFTDAAGKPIALNAGQTWITLVNSAGSIVSAP